MKKLLLLFLFVTSISFGQQAYYNDVDLTANGLQLRDNLATKIINTHTHYLSYADVWEALKITDLDPDDTSNSKVLLIYGYNDSDGNYVSDRTRSKTANGGTAGTDWNREHTYAKSLGNPNLGTSGPGSDAHHLRAADVSFNSQRSSKKFAAGSGVAGDSNGGWYPGDEWKGDIARMMMYMYLRYGNQCLPSGVAIGSTNAVDANMIDLLLQWNAEDPVSQEEDNRNTYLSDANNTYGQGNRNPFIDNPYLATRIWGGPTAEDRWNTVADTQAPTAPTNLTASNVTNTTADLNWTASTDDVGVTSYQIFVNGSLYTTSTTNSDTLTGLTQNTSYTVTVYAKDAAGNTSTVSNTATFTTTNVIDTQAPTTITDLSASNTTSTSTDLTWTASTDNVGVTDYDVYKDGVFLASSNTNSYNVTGLTDSTSYSFTVYAKDAAGNTSNVSNTANVTTLAPPVNNTCGTETFTNLGSNASNYTTYNWTGDNGVQWTSTDSRNDQNLAGDRAITIRNGSLTSGNVSGGISEVTVTTQLVFSGSSGTFNLRINGTVVGTIPYSSTVQTTTVNGFNISGNISISLTDNSSTSNRVMFDNLSWNCYNSTLSTSKFVADLFDVYPNPSTNNSLTISVKNNTELKGVQLYNTLGQLIMDIKKPKIIQNRIYIENIPSGIYILKAFNDDLNSTKRVIIQ